MSCSLCGGRLYANNKIGVCIRNPDCKREHDRLASAQRRRNGKVKRNPQWLIDNIDKQRGYAWKSKYGDITSYQTLLEVQNGVCAICGKAERDNPYGRLYVDHDHSCCPGGRTCGKCIRGLLCNACNIALGYFKDNPKALLAAVDYLERGGVFSA